MHWNTKRLPFDVVQCDVDCADCSAKNTASFEVLTAVKLLPNRSGQHGIVPNQELTVMIDRAHDCALPTGETRLAPPMQALIRFHLDQQLVPDANPDGKAVNGSDPHCLTLNLEFVGPKGGGIQQPPASKSDCRDRAISPFHDSAIRREDGVHPGFL